MGRLSENDEKRIIDLIHGWVNPKLTWELLVIACENELGIETTRKTLNTRSYIKAVMKIKKGDLRTPSDMPGYLSDVGVANQKLVQLVKKVELLEKANNDLVEQFLRWQYNAKNYNVSEEMLNRPLPKTFR